MHHQQVRCLQFEVHHELEEAEEAEEAVAVEVLVLAVAMA